MALANLIYAAIHSDRVPIIPEFIANRGEWQTGACILYMLSLVIDVNLSKTGYLPFGEIFDIPAISAALRIPILEWHQVKDYSDETTRKSDSLGCWSVWAPYGGNKKYREDWFSGPRAAIGV